MVATINMPKINIDDPFRITIWFWCICFIIFCEWGSLWLWFLIIICMLDVKSRKFTWCACKEYEVTTSNSKIWKNHVVKYKFILHELGRELILSVNSVLFNLIPYVTFLKYKMKICPHIYFFEYILLFLLKTIQKMISEAKL